jgi:hypothetical protein
VYAVVPRARGDVLAEATACATYTATLALLGEESSKIGTSVDFVSTAKIGTSPDFVRLTAERKVRGLDGVEMEGGGVVEREGGGSPGGGKVGLAGGFGCLLIFPVTKEEPEDMEGLKDRVRVVGALVACGGDVGGAREREGAEGGVEGGAWEGEGGREELLRAGVSLEKLELEELEMEESRKRREPMLGLLPIGGAAW